MFQVAEWRAIFTGTGSIANNSWQETKQQRWQYYSPKSPDRSTLTDRQPSWPLRRILVAAPLPALLEPPVSRTWPRLSRQVAIPSPSTQTGMTRTLRAVGLHNGQIDGTGCHEAKQTQELYSVLVCINIQLIKH